jgi:hypothetical protein
MDSQIRKSDVRSTFRDNFHVHQACEVVQVFHVVTVEDHAVQQCHDVLIHNKLQFRDFLKVLVTSTKNTSNGFNLGRELTMTPVSRSLQIVPFFAFLSSI